MSAHGSEKASDCTFGGDLQFLPHGWSLAPRGIVKDLRDPHLYAFVLALRSRDSAPI